ncbi:hypothetical protein BV25DRAFT_1824223 [Artomyces pyxidatus]|uniref:Uncharacterized protein n=1 Tax=Artomyces pyxidatus TaxID=48021 RepID=A0ACB8T4P2_9AGAM|nr:hypothetical protein BV25DRAFT_1824223 [Artomyces pyxidatus]
MARRAVVAGVAGRDLAATAATHQSLGRWTFTLLPSLFQHFSYLPVRCTALYLSRILYLQHTQHGRVEQRQRTAEPST